MNLTAAVLENAFVRLEPLNPALRETVRRALDVDPQGWSIMSGAGHGQHFDDWWDSAMAGMAEGRRIPYAVVRKPDGAVVGSTSYLEITPAHRRVEVGATFYRPEARGGAVNPACKRLLLGHAFDAGAMRVELIADALNVHSRAAILKLGAVEEGVLRRHKVTFTGRVRDTAVFSVTDQDWPQVRERLDARLAALAV